MNIEDFENKIFNDDCFNILKKMPSNSVDLVVTDPPYALTASDDKQYGVSSKAMSWLNRTGFMGSKWDSCLASIDIWKQLHRVLKSGSFMFVMMTPRQDSLWKSIYDITNAGFKTNFSSMFWAYAGGMPKAMNISLGIDKNICAKSLTKKLGRRPANEEFEKELNKFMGVNNYKECIYKNSISHEAKYFNGFYTYSPKPVVEVIIVAMKPLTCNNYIEQSIKYFNQKQRNDNTSIKHGCVNFDDCRIPYVSDDDKWVKPEPKYRRSGSWCFVKKDPEGKSNEKGRFPSNLLISDKVISNNMFYRYYDIDKWFDERIRHLPSEVRDTYPFFVIKKPKTIERNIGMYGKKNLHVTIKPINLFSYLIVLGSEVNDIVLDPFLGSGTAVISSILTNRKYIGIERDDEYYKVAKERIESIINMNLSSKEKNYVNKSLYRSNNAQYKLGDFNASQSVR